MSYLFIKQFIDKLVLLTMYEIAGLIVILRILAIISVVSYAVVTLGAFFLYRLYYKYKGFTIEFKYFVFSMVFLLLIGVSFPAYLHYLDLGRLDVALMIAIFSQMCFVGAAVNMGVSVLLAYEELSEAPSTKKKRPFINTYRRILRNLMGKDKY